MSPDRVQYHEKKDQDIGKIGKLETAIGNDEQRHRIVARYRLCCVFCFSFLFAWQHVSAGSHLRGGAALAAVLEWLVCLEAAGTSLGGGPTPGAPAGLRPRLARPLLPVRPGGMATAHAVRAGRGRDGNAAHGRPRSVLRPGGLGSDHDFPRARLPGHTGEQYPRCCGTSKIIAAIEHPPRDRQDAPISACPPGHRPDPRRAYSILRAPGRAHPWPWLSIGPSSLIPNRYHLPSGAGPEPTTPLHLARPETPKHPETRRLGPMKGPKSPRLQA